MVELGNLKATMPLKEVVGEQLKEPRTLKGTNHRSKMVDGATPLKSKHLSSKKVGARSHSLNLRTKGAGECHY